jgi:type IV secretion system protein VirB11
MSAAETSQRSMGLPLNGARPRPIVAPREFVLQDALAPIRLWLDAPDVIEISINRPGEVYVERLGGDGMKFTAVEELNEVAIRHMAERVAASTRQEVNSARPLLAATLPGGERFQAVLPPAAPLGGAISIRKHVISDLSLEEYERRGAFAQVEIRSHGKLSQTEAELVKLLKAKDLKAFLTLAVSERQSMVISGGTSTGKTTFLNMLLKLVRPGERLITIEDVRELKPPQSNTVTLLVSKGDQGEASVTIQDLLEATLRMRPDRIFLGELRSKEAFTFLRAVNTGHPGSITTVHADSPDGAYQQLVMMGLQADLGLKAEDIAAYVRSVIPIVVQLKRTDTARFVSEIYYSKLREERGRGGTA